MKAQLERQIWIDSVKGLTITLVVLNHVLFGVASAIPIPQSVMDLYTLTKPIRMPLFFLVAGFFAKKALFSDWRTFVDGKILHFAYYFILWNTISVLVRYALSAFANHEADLNDIWRLLWKPSFSLWFIYALLLAFLAARLTREVSPKIQIFIATVIAVIVTFYSKQLPYVFTSTLQFYPLFLFGCYASSEIRAFVMRASWFYVWAFLAGYIALATYAYHYLTVYNPFLFYPMALFSSFAIMISVYKAGNNWFARMLYAVGRYSLYIYLMHFVPAAAVRYLGVGLGLGESPGIIVLFGTPLSILVCIIVYKFILKLGALRFLVNRPALFRLS